MANIDFHPRPVAHAPSPFGFGFGLNSPPSSILATGWQSPVTPGHTNPSAFHQLASSVNQHALLRPQKRRHDPEDDIEATRLGSLQDDSMDRSPTPERPKRAPPKRARLAPTRDTPPRNEDTAKENKAPTSSDDNDIDVGLLLASLPSQSLLPLLTSLLNAQPSLKSTILPLIPRPTLDTATQAVVQAAKKLRDAYPYSTFSQSGTSNIFGFGRPSPSQNTSGFGLSNHIDSNTNGGMRDSYIISRIRPHITEFVATFFSYLPYFSSAPFQSTPQTAAPHQHTQPTTLPPLHKDKPHPSETFLFLSAVTNQILLQAPLTQASLFPVLLPRLSEEWNAWTCKVDEVVNQQGGMFGRETVQSWERILDDLSTGKGSECANMMRRVRDVWISKVGWLTGRMIHQQMEEL